MSRAAKSLPWLSICWTLPCPISDSLAYSYLLHGDPRFTSSPRAKCSSLYKHWASAFASSGRRLGVSKGEACQRLAICLMTICFTIYFKTILASSSNEKACSSLLSFSAQSILTLANLSGKNQSINNASCFKNFLIRLWILLILLLVMVRPFCTHWRNSGTSVGLLDLRSETVQANPHVEKSTLQKSSFRKCWWR